MIPKYNKVHNRFKLNGVHYTYETLKNIAHDYIKEGEPFKKTIGEFFNHWLDHKTYVEVNTSGSTGTPKIITLNKQAMVHSAIATGNFFKLKSGDTALHCLPTNFIAGKMMLVRAIILGLEIDVIKPVSNPMLFVKKKYNFSAMTPYQVENSLGNLDKITTLIIGGAQVSKSLQRRLQQKQVKAFETYGMTETITHIAAKQINNFSQSKFVGTSYFKVLPNITISQDERDCLVIDASRLTTEKIITNDIVRQHSKTEFEWLGRFDNVINSGGIKLYPEQIEVKLSEIINSRFFIASQPDDHFGEKVILVIETSSLDINNVLNTLKNFQLLDKYEIPKQIFKLPKFIETASGKINRQQTLALI